MNMRWFNLINLSIAKNLAATLLACAFAFSCRGPEPVEPTPPTPVTPVDPTPAKDTQAPVITVSKESVNVIAGPAITLSDSELKIGEDTVASWKDGVSSTCKVALTFTPAEGSSKTVNDWDKLSEEGRLHLKATDEAGNEATAEITLTAVAVYGLESLSQLELRVDEECELLRWVTPAEGITICKVEVEVDGKREQLTAPFRYVPEFPGTVYIIIEISGMAEEGSSEIRTDGLSVKPLAYAAPQIKDVSPDDILPIVWQVEGWDIHAYEHIEHLRIAEATRVRDMMWKYWAWNYTPEEYQELMMRLNTWMLWENPIWYDNYEAVGWEFENSPSEHAHDEWDILNTIINHANFKVINWYDDVIKTLYELSNNNNTSINIFWLSKSADVYSKENYRNMSNRKNYLQKNNLLVFWSWSNIKYSNGIIKNKIYQEDFDLPDEYSVYTWQSCANSKNDTNVDRHLILTFWTNPNWNTDITNYTWWSKFPIWFNNNILFAWRTFPYKNIDWKISGQTGSSWYFEDSWYASSYPNYVNVAMADLCFQIFAEIKDIDELLDMIRSTSLTDYIRYNDMTQELHLINPAWFIKQYLMPSELTVSAGTDEYASLEKGYYKGLVFAMPGAEVRIDGQWIAYDAKNKDLILGRNPMNLEWRLSGTLLRKCGYTSGQSIEGQILAVDDQWNGLRLEKDFSVQVK